MALSKQVLEAQAQVGNHTNQEWARIPRVGESLEGLFRSQLFALVKTGQIKTAAIKPAGASRTGVRLIHIPSLRAWIAKHVETL
ncbi:MAG: hypothetical protein WCJ02_14760 [bacterium]